MNFKQLEAFVGIAELQSFTRAAKQMYLSQPAISFQIKALEEELKITLFRRDEKKVVLTEAGRLLYPEARQMLGHYNKIRAGLDALKGLESGSLSIGAGTIPGEYLLPTCISLFRKRYPGVRIKMRIAGSGEVIRWIREREIDLGVVGSAPEGENLVSTSWLDDELVLIVPPGHPWEGSTIDPDELYGEKWLLREEGSGTRRSVEEIMDKHALNLKQLDVEMELGSTRAVISAVQAGLGVGFVSRWAAAEGLAAGKVGPATIKGITMRRKLYLVRYPTAMGSCAADAFFNFLSEVTTEIVLQKM